MKEYFLELTFAYKNDGPSDLDKYGMELTPEDIEKKNYNQTFTKHVMVVAKSLLEAGAKAMVQMHKCGFCEGNYLYLINIKKVSK